MIFEYNRSNGGQFKCRVKCMRCTGVLENGDRCPVITCDHLPFCARHLRQKGLEIRDVVFRKDPMYYPEDPGIPGKGLFALQPFKKGARLCDYTSAPTEEPFGELITKEQLDERYGEGKYDYGPYAMPRAADPPPLTPTIRRTTQNKATVNPFWPTTQTTASFISSTVASF